MEIRSLTNSLKTCAHQYFTLGVQLGLDFDEIKGFQAQANNPAICLTTLLQQYMSNMSPNVEEVCQAVKSVGRNDLAMDLRDRKYKGILSQDPYTIYANNVFHRSKICYKGGVRTCIGRLSSLFDMFCKF